MRDAIGLSDYRSIEVIGLYYSGEIVYGADLGELIVRIAREQGVGVRDKDVIVAAQKVVSKAEGRVVDLDSVVPSREAVEIAEKTDKDPCLVELILRESSELLKVVDRHIIVLTRHGIVCANAGIDRSNSGGLNKVVLLPVDPDGSARRIRESIEKLTGVRVAVVITDTYGRQFRRGVVNMAIGFSGINPFRDYRGLTDRYGYVMRVTRVNIVDEIAAAAELVMGQGSENTPFAIVRGVDYEYSLEFSYRDVYMDKSRWLFK